MEVREWLDRVRVLQVELDRRLDELARLQSVGLTARVSWASGRANKKVSVVERQVMAKAEVFRSLERLQVVMGEVSGAIRKVADEQERQILEMRYVGLYSWREVARRLGVSLSQVYKLHRSALENFEIPR